MWCLGCTYTTESSIVYLKFRWSVFHPPSYPGGDQEADPEEWGTEGEQAMSELKAWPSCGCHPPPPNDHAWVCWSRTSPQAATGMGWAGDGRARSEEWQCGNEGEARGALSAPCQGPSPSSFPALTCPLPASACLRASPAPHFAPWATALSQLLCRISIPLLLWCLLFSFLNENSFLGVSIFVLIKVIWVCYKSFKTDKQNIKSKLKSRIIPAPERCSRC